MAAITLKDLMDPLTKIAAAAEQTDQKLEAVLAVVTGGGGGGDALQHAMVMQLEAQTEYLRQIAFNTQKQGTFSGLFGKGGGEAKEADEAAKVLETLGIATKSTAKGMLLWMFVPKKAISKFVMFIKDTFAALAEKDTKKAKEGVDLLDAMGGAILKFSKALALSALLLIPGMIAIIPLVISIGLVGGALAVLGLVEKQVKAGSDALDGMGDAIFSFALGLASFALVTMFILMQPAILLGMVGALLLVGGAIALIGLVEKQVNKGSLAVALMGLGIAVFGLGYAVFASFTRDLEWEDIAKQAVLLVGMGVVFALAGMGLSMIAQGALSFALIGLGMVVFGLGYTPFAKATEGVTWESMGIQLALLTGIGLVMAGAGALVAASAGLILLGPVMYAAVGGALLVLAPGLEAIKKVGFTEEDSSDLAIMLSGVKSAFLGTDTKSEGGIGGFFKKIGGAITGAVDAVRMIEAAAGFAAAGLALSKLSVGLKEFKKLEWEESDSLELTTVLSGVTTAFAQAGGEGANPGGLFGAVFGSFFSPNAVEKGIDSVMDAGKALTNIAEGLKAFQKLIESGVKFGEPDNEGRYEEGTLGYAVVNTVGFINEAFSAVAEQGNVDAGGFFGTLFGIKKNKVAEGISSVKGAGKALNDIASGLMAFQDLITSGVKFGDMSAGAEGDYGGKDTLAYAVINTVGFVNEAFAAVADQGNVQQGGFFGSLFGIQQNKVQEGIDSVKGAGKELTNIAEGLKGFQELIESDVDFDTLGDAIVKTMGFVQEAFSAVADAGNVQQGGFWGSLFNIKQNKVQEGIDSVKGAGDELSKIAEALNTFNGIEDVTTLGANISEVVSMVSTAFMKVGGMTDTKSAGSGWFTFTWEENLVEKGIEAVKGAGNELTEIANGLKSFEGMDDPKAVADSISVLFTSIADTFTVFYSKNPMFSHQLEDFSDFITTISDAGEDGKLHDAADGMTAISTAVNSISIPKADAFANLFKSSAELQSNRKAYLALADAVQEIKNVLGGSGEGSEEEGGIFDKLNPFKKDEPSGGGLSSSLKNLNRTLGSVQATLNRLPAAIQSIKIEVSD